MCIFTLGYDETLVSLSGRVVYLMAGVIAIIISAAYSAALISSLANQNIKLPFDNLQEFVDVVTSYKLAAVQKIVVTDAFQVRPNFLYK